MDNLTKYITKNSGIKYEQVSARKNQTLFFEGDECKMIGLIISGKVSIISYLNDGQEVVYNELGKGDMFGNNLVFSSQPFYRGDVVAVEESEIAYIKKEDLLLAMTQNVGLLEMFLKQQSEERIVYYLTFHKGEVQYKSVTKLAKELYLTRETLSRTMYKMEKNGLVKIESKTIRLQ